jgi:hypothetical protein
MDAELVGMMKAENYKFTYNSTAIETVNAS